MILMYHNIDDNTGFNTVSVKNFEDQMSYLKNDSPFNIVSMDEYLKFHNNTKNVAITFDDAYVNINTKVLPVIKKNNIPVTIFVPVGLVGKHNIWDTSMGQKKIDILSWTELKDLKNENIVCFGSHSYNHVSLRKTDPASLSQEFHESKIILEEELGRDIEYFAYPFGQQRDIIENAKTTLQYFGYKAGFTTNWCRTNNVDNQYLLNRIEIQSHDDLAIFKRKLTRKIDLRYYKQLAKNLLFSVNHSQTTPEYSLSC